QLGFEQPLLALAIRVVYVVIQTEFAHGAAPRVIGVSGQAIAQVRQVLRLMLLEKDRMRAEGGVEPGVLLDHRPEPAPVAAGHSHQQQALHAESLAVGQHRIAVAVKIVKIQVGMGIDVGIHVPSIVRVGPARKRDGRAGGPASVSFCSAGAYGAVFRVTISRFFGVLPIGLSVDAVDGRQVLSRKELYMYRMFGIVMLAAMAGQVQAKVDPVQAARLGADLTPLGAERAGNAAGTIPAWTGGVTPPAGYQPGMHHLDPYADDA